MSQATQGNTVKVHYTGTLADESVFDSSRQREPIEFEVGAGQMIKGFDAAVEGMKVGESKKVAIPADEAYGQKREDMLFNVPKDKLPEGMEPQKGMQLESVQPDGHKQILVIDQVLEDEVILDANHPFGWQRLDF